MKHASKATIATVLATLVFGLSTPATAQDAPPSSGFVGGVVLKKDENQLVTATFTHHAATVSSLMDDGAGIPIYMTCYDDAADGISCSLQVYRCETPFFKTEFIDGAVGQGLGLSIVEARIPASAYAGAPASTFCAIVGINGVQLTLDTLVLVEAA